MRIPRTVVSLSAAHFLIDNYSSMLGAFLPFLHEQLNLSLSEAGVLGGILVFSSSLMQPVYGYLSDRWQSKIFVALGPAIAGIFISGLGLAPNFLALTLMVFLGGIGIAAFHPQGAAVATEGAESDHGFHLSVFITSGMMGYSLGPIYITAIIAMAGLHNSYWAALPGLLMSAYLMWRGPSPSRDTLPVEISRLKSILKAFWTPLIILYGLGVVRAIIQLVFVAFLPLYFTTRGYTAMESSQFLTLFLLAGGSASFFGGILADRIGGKSVLAVSMLGAFPLLLGFLTSEGAVSVVLCTLGGAFLLLSTPVTVLMAQKLVRSGASTVSALMMGFAWGMGGLFIPLVGMASDSFGMQRTLTCLIFVLLPGFALSQLISSGRSRPAHD